MITKLKDVDREILYRMKDEDILKTCSVNKVMSEKVCDETFFHNLLLKRYPKALESLLKNIKQEPKIKEKENKYKQIYLKILYYKDMMAKESQKDYGEPFIFTDGDILLYYKLLTRPTEDTVYRAAEYGLKDLLSYILHFPPIYEIITSGDLFEGMVKGNHFTLSEIKNLIPEHHLENVAQTNLAYALMYAVINRNKEIVDYTLEMGAPINFALDGAARLGDISLIQYYLDRGADNIYSAAEYALDNPDEETAFNTLKYLRNVDDDIENAMMDWEFWRTIRDDAAAAGHLNIYKYAEDFENYDLLSPMLTAMTFKRWNIINYLIKEKGFSQFQEAYDFAKNELKDPVLTLFFSNYI